MEINKTKMKDLLKAVIILAILIAIALGAGFAYAKYVTSLNRNTSAGIAKWSFKVLDKDSSTIDVLDFPITRTDNNTEVDSSTSITQDTTLYAHWRFIE